MKTTIFLVLLLSIMAVFSPVYASESSGTINVVSVQDMVSLPLAVALVVVACVVTYVVAETQKEPEKD